MTDDLLIGFDLGTSGIKSLLTNTRGETLAGAKREVEFIHPSPGIYEIDPETYFQNIPSIIRELTRATDAVERIKAISFCAASGNTLLLDGSHRPLGNAISWMDTRTKGRERELWPDLPHDRIHEITGWPWGGMFPLAHLAWLRDNAPESWSRARYHTMLNDYVYFRLGGRLVVDPSKATTFYLQDQRAEAWDTGLIGFLGIETRNLSEIIPSGTVCGPLTVDAADECGLSKETLLVAGSFDHPSAARSTGVTNQGDLLISAGTSWVAYAPSRDREIGIERGMLVDPFLSPGGCWGLMFALTAVAERIDEYLSGIFGSPDKKTLYRRFDDLAEESVPGADGTYINPWNRNYSEAAADLEGLEKRHLARALMEGCVYLMKERIDSVREALKTPITRIVLTGGPTRSAIWTRILADVLDTPLAIPETGQHAGAAGAAILAGIGAGLYTDAAEGCRMAASKEKVIHPDKENAMRYRETYAEFRRSTS